MNFMYKYVKDSVLATGTLSFDWNTIVVISTPSYTLLEQQHLFNNYSIFI